MLRQSLRAVRCEWRGTVHSTASLLTLSVPLTALLAFSWPFLLSICALVRHVVHSLSSCAVGDVRESHRKSIPLLSVHSSSFVFLQVGCFYFLSRYLLFISFSSGPHEPGSPMVGGGCREDLSCQCHHCSPEQGT